MISSSVPPSGRRISSSVVGLRAGRPTRGRAPGRASRRRRQCRHVMPPLAEHARDSVEDRRPVVARGAKRIDRPAEVLEARVDDRVVGSASGSSWSGPSTNTATCALVVDEVGAGLAAVDQLLGVGRAARRSADEQVEEAPLELREPRSRLSVAGARAGHARRAGVGRAARRRRSSSVAGSPGGRGRGGRAGCRS